MLKYLTMSGLEFVKPTPAIQDKCMEGITFVKNPTGTKVHWYKVVAYWYKSTCLLCQEPHRGSRECPESRRMLCRVC